MKFFSLIPWCSRSAVPAVKSILLFGNDENIALFRLQWLKTYYQTKGYQNFTLFSETDLLSHVFEHDLFQQDCLKKVFIYPEVTDSSLSAIKECLEDDHFSDILIISGKKLTSKSKLVQFYQNNNKVATLSCYDSSEDEMKSAIKWYGSQYNLTLEVNALDQLSQYFLYHPLEFFTCLEMLSIFCDDQTITENDVAENLKIEQEDGEDIGSCFLKDQKEYLERCLKCLESTDYVAAIRKIMQDVMALMGLGIYRVPSESIKSFWMKQSKKIIYPRIPLYQATLSRWPIKRCGETLECLIRLEKKLKSHQSPSLTQLSYELLALLK